MVLSRVTPDAPASLIGSGRRVSATVEAVIEADGRVRDAWYACGDREWAEAVAIAVRKWMFQPARQNGVAIPVRFRLTSTLTSTGPMW